MTGDRGGADDVPPRSKLFVPAVSTVTSSDPGDTSFWKGAEAAQADYIETGNKRISRMTPWRDARRERWRVLDRIAREI